MAVTSYETLIKYLDAIDNKGNHSAAGAPHGVFWRDAVGCFCATSVGCVESLGWANS